ncbi:MAG: hypothetical protein ABJN69_08100 [Hellea sp.]
MLNTYNTLETVINEVRSSRLGVYDANDKVRASGEHFSVYSPQGDRVTLDGQIYVGAEVLEFDILSDGNVDYDTLPSAIKGTGWTLLYSGEIIESVLASLRYQLPEFDNNLVLKAIDYYCEYDCFYDFKDSGLNAGKLGDR